MKNYKLEDVYTLVVHQESLILTYEVLLLNFSTA